MGDSDDNRTTSRDVLRMIVADGARMSSGIEALATSVNDHGERLTKVETERETEGRQSMASRLGPLLLAAAPGILTGAIAWGSMSARLAAVEKAQEAHEDAGGLYHPYGVDAKVEAVDRAVERLTDRVKDIERRGGGR